MNKNLEKYLDLPCIMITLFLYGKFGHYLQDHAAVLQLFLSCLSRHKHNLDSEIES